MKVRSESQPGQKIIRVPRGLRGLTLLEVCHLCHIRQSQGSEGLRVTPTTYSVRVARIRGSRPHAGGHGQIQEVYSSFKGTPKVMSSWH